MLQRTLSDQEQSSRREIEEIHLYARQAQGNLERQLREFKVQLQARSKEMMELRSEVKERELEVEIGKKEIQTLRLIIK